MTEEIRENPVETIIPQVDNAIPGVEYDITDDIPYVLEEPGHIRFTWRTHHIEIEARHFNNIRCHAEIEVWFEDADHRRLMLPVTHVDLKSAQSRRAVSSQLKKDNELWVLNWDWFIDCVAYRIIAVSRQQEPILEIISQPDLDLEPDYLLMPVLYRGHPTVFFGSKGSTKSLLALVIAYIVQLPLVNNGVGFTTDGNNTHTVLYLDYEDEQGTFTKRWTAIQNGFKSIIPENPNDKIPDDLELPILYKRMTTRLADSVESLRNEIADRNISLLIVDSLGPAARGDLYSPEPAIEYNVALRALGVTSLTLAHLSKDPNQKSKSIFGSAYFTYLARSVWECKAESHAGETDVISSIEEVNANLTAKHGALGFRFAFDNHENTIRIQEIDLEGTSLAGGIPMSLRIKNLLRTGARGIPEIAEALDLADKEKSVKATVYRLAKRETLIKVGDDKWGLKQQ